VRESDCEVTDASRTSAKRLKSSERANESMIVNTKQVKSQLRECKSKTTVAATKGESKAEMNRVKLSKRHA
jgi:hypothetical protein